MKKTNLLILPLIFGTLLVGCGDDKKENSNVDVCTGIECNRIAKIDSDNNSPKVPFYMNVNEERTLGITIDKVSSLPDSQKYFTWEVSEKRLASIEIVEGVDHPTTKVKVTAKNVGTVDIVCRSTVVSTVSKVFTINIINFKEGDYLWEYDSNIDRAKFGYSTSNKLADQSGDVKLQGMDWHFERSRLSSFNMSNSGTLGFGKGCDYVSQENFEDVTFTSNNSKKIKQIIVETGSANSASDFKVCVGENVITDQKAPKLNNKACAMIKSSVNDEGYEGNIEISWHSEYDVDAATDPECPRYNPNYDSKSAPGAIYLRSIYIMYA